MVDDIHELASLGTTVFVDPNMLEGSPWTLRESLLVESRYAGNKLYACGRK